MFAALIFAVPFAAPAIANTFTVPFFLTLAIAVAALVGIAVYLRRLRTAGALTVANGAIGGASAALVLAVALLATVSFGATTPAVAHDTPPATQTGSQSGTPTEAVAPVELPDYQPIEIEGLEGFQLPTE